MGVRERKNGAVLKQLKVETPNQMLFKSLKIANYNATALQHNQEKAQRGRVPNGKWEIKYRGK